MKYVCKYVHSKYFFNTCDIVAIMCCLMNSSLVWWVWITGGENGEVVQVVLSQIIQTQSKESLWTKIQLSSCRIY